MMPGFTFGLGTGNPGGSSGGFTFSTPSSTTTMASSSSTPQLGFSAPAPTSGPTSSSGFSFSSFGIPSATTAPPAVATTSGTGGFSFNLGTPANTTTSSTGFSPFGITTTSTTPTLGATSTTGSTLTSAQPPTTGFGIAPSSTSGTLNFQLPSSSATPTGTPTTTPSLFGPPASLSTATTTTSASAAGAGGAPTTSVSARPLEERLNKWLVELKEQDEKFVRQAAHVNAWDQILQNGHDQVQTLKDTLHTVKSDQARLEAEIDFIRGQQEELERLLEPLESATAANPATQLHQGDRQRDNMYYLAQSLDAQLRQMTDDLSKVIEHLNTNAKPWQPSDPVALVARILSAHMDSLKWVDQNTALLSQKVEEVARVANAGKRG